MQKIDYYFTPLSPWCYLAGTRAEEIAGKYGAELRYIPLDLLALFARTGGVAPADRHPSRLAYRKQELTRWSAHLGMPITLQPAHWPTNPAPAAYAIIAAQKAGGGDLGGLVHGLLRACWAEDQDIAQDEVISRVMRAAGFDPMIALTGMADAAETYARNLEEASAAGVFGAPTYVTQDGAHFWGQDRLSFLEAHLAS